MLNQRTIEPEKRKMLRTSLGLICLAPVLLMVGCSDTPDDEDDTTATEGMTLTFMSRKLYGGADDELNAAFRAQDEAQWTEGMEAFHEALLTKSFVPRAELIADEIKEIKPDFVGLQEALIISTQTPPDGSETSATTVEEDYLQILLAALDARGEQYEAVSTHDGVDAEFAGTESDVRYAERTVLLARSDLATRGIELSNAKQGSFTEQSTCVLPSLGGDISITRGWASIGVDVKGKTFNAVVSHLDFTCVGFDPSVQLGEGDELIAATAPLDPVVVIADLNSNADTSGVSSNPLTTTETYNNLRKAGFSDAWTGDDEGFNCCFTDDLLDNDDVPLDQRIDVILYRGPFTPAGAGLTGLTARTPEGYLPSNHAGTWASLKF
ncbi:hypothetical protein WMF27_00790 [Sorangium sp. So ce281]|uniref:hypothetical protein n=1 Tax=unclassified Sorangium TaxID=2621164 RepID=UPI003F62E3BA